MLYDNNMENITHQVKSCSRNILLIFVFLNTICFLVNNVSWLTDFLGDFIRIVLLSKPKKIKLQLTADPHNVLCPLIYSTIGLE